MVISFPYSSFRGLFVTTYVLTTGHKENDRGFALWNEVRRGELFVLVNEDGESCQGDDRIFRTVETHLHVEGRCRYLLEKTGSGAMNPNLPIEGSHENNVAKVG